ncbi:MAG: GIY-YIG nuclease family protein, partial [Candidatus Daviesbacteria bacterium]|nr:GIY-YIG nuclease family protein [Candidatus Daviesbacteria bacterium]
KRPSLPIDISEEVLNSLPEGSGVYIFYNKDNSPLYIGKSKNIKNRVLSHFYNTKKDSLDRKIAQDINRIECRETAGELGALLLESSLIKKLTPLYNRKLRYASKLLALKKIITPEKYYSVSVTSLQEVPVEDFSGIMGIFKSMRELKSFLISVAKEYFLCLKLLGLQKSAKNCFNYHLNLCKGSCGREEAPAKYNLRFNEAFLKTKIKDWPFKGPIGLKEKSKKEEVFVIDKWCVLGKLKSGSESLDDISREYLFDTDTYKILSSYLKGSKELEIFPLSRVDLNYQ